MSQKSWTFVLLYGVPVIIITGVLDRTRIKYKDRGYRYVLLEAGHMSQNICLLATELGLSSCALGGYIDSEFNKLVAARGMLQ